MRTYEDFLEDKAQLESWDGFEPLWMPDFLFDFQQSLIQWSIAKGRAAIFADCGLGKTPMQLVWVENIIRKTNKPVLIMAPLAVSSQTVKEGAKFGVEVTRSRDGLLRGGKCIVTNYEQLHRFNPHDFAGVACDESSILKNFDGATRKAITDFMRKMKYRSLWTATAAPNDYIELGTSSEAIGDMGYMDMLGRFFKNAQNSLHPSVRRGGMGDKNAALSEKAKFRFRGHAERDFWRWVCSWARAVRKPSDLGFDDGSFILPELISRQHTIHASTRRDGYLFDLPAHGLEEQRAERRHSIPERCEKAAELCAANDGASVAWCNLNDEGDLLTELIPGSRQISGAMDDDEKEELFEAFASGQLTKLVTKAVLAGLGLNWQHCAHQTSFPSHSFEQYYQAIRRSWRFGQKNPVVSDIITSEGEASVLRNLQRKAGQAEVMFAKLVELMGAELKITKQNPYTNQQTNPSWLS